MGPASQEVWSMSPKLLEVKMKPKEDPKTLFEQVAAISNWYNSSAKKVAKEQIIAVVLKAAPKEYASVLTSEQEKRGSTLQLSHSECLSH